MRSLATILVLVITLVLIGCGSGTAPVTQPLASVASTATAPFNIITPSSTTLGPSGTAHFTASLPVTWTVQEGAAGGSISTDGTYTAPGATGTYHVVGSLSGSTNTTYIATVTVISTGFTFTTSMNDARLQHTATLLPNGKVLIVGGGTGPDTIDGYSPVASVELFDPAAASFTSIGMEARVQHTATLLANGKVLIAGGDPGPGSSSTADLYDSTTATLQTTGPMTAAREWHSATLLNDGRVLIAGGLNVQGISLVVLNSAEIYDPASGTFTGTGTMGVARAGHSATLLLSGKVLIAGGAGQSSAEIYDPVSGTFSSVGPMSKLRSDHTATLLGNGTVLVVGGNLETSSADVFDPSTNLFKETAPMAVPRTNNTATLLPSGTVLIAGGITVKKASAASVPSYSDTPVAEIFDPATATFKLTGSLGTGRFFHAANLLPDGSVLVTGGAQTPDGTKITVLKASEIYK